MTKYNDEISEVEGIIDILEAYDYGHINLMEAVARFQEAGSVMEPDDMIEMLLEFDRNNVVLFPRKEE